MKLLGVISEANGNLLIITEYMKNVSVCLIHRQDSQRVTYMWVFFRVPWWTTYVPEDGQYSPVFLYLILQCVYIAHQQLTTTEQCLGQMIRL